jgi:hypothetical protein
MIGTAATRRKANPLEARANSFEPEGAVLWKGPLEWQRFAPETIEFQKDHQVEVGRGIGGCAR